MSPALPIRIFRPNPRLEIAFDVRTKNPIYVMEKMDGVARLKTRERHPFYEEENIAVEYRSRLCSFLQSGFDRGHMAPAADFGADSVKDTYNMCNISPQDQFMNRSIWLKLERWCRKVAESELGNNGSKRKIVQVVTGPVWMPKQQTEQPPGGTHVFEYAAVGKRDALIHVPTHFFKVIVVAIGKHIQKFACFLIPNQKQTLNAKLEQYLIHWDRLEILTGLQFFPNLVTSNWKEEARMATHSMMMGQQAATSASSSEDAVDKLVPTLQHLSV